jgi:polysaccharide biosynthesis transport protein
MSQYDFQISDLERIFRKRYKIVAFIALCIIGFSSLFVYLKPPVYSAISTVEFNSGNTMALGSQNIGPSGNQNIQTQTRIITSSPVLLRAAKRISILPDSVSEENYSANEKILKTLEGLRSKIAVSIISGTDIIQISVTSGDARQTRDLANAVAAAYKEYSLDTKKREALSTRKFIETQLDKCKSELLASQFEVKMFQESHKIPSIEKIADATMTRAQQVESDLSRLDADILTIKIQQRKLSSRNGFPHAASANADGKASEMDWVSSFTDADPGLQSLNSRLIQLQLQLEDQRAFYKNNHPANSEIERKISATKEQMLAEYEKKLAELGKMRSKLFTDKQENDAEIRKLPDDQMTYARLYQKMKVNEELFLSLTKKLNEAMITEAGIVDDVSIMSIATLPSPMLSVKKMQLLLAGVLLGIILGVLFVVVQEMFDSSIGTIEEVEQTLKLPVLAVVPHMQSKSDRHNGYLRLTRAEAVPTHAENQQKLITQFKPKDPCAEAYRILRSNIEFLSLQSEIRTILVSSATKQEGKSLTISNLAVAFAQKGKKVLILECNLRRPTIYKLFGIEKSPGITDILTKKEPWHKCIKTVSDLLLGDFPVDDIFKVPGLDKLHFITYGHTPLNPAELLSSSAMDTLLSEVRQYFDIVLIDAPPVLPVADSMQLATKVDAMLLVYKAGKVSRSSVKLAKQRLETVKAKILGVVLNGIKPETSGNQYARAYIHYYGNEEQKILKKSTKSEVAQSRAA